MQADDYLETGRLRAYAAPRPSLFGFSGSGTVPAAELLGALALALATAAAPLVLSAALLRWVAVGQPALMSFRSGRSS